MLLGTSWPAPRWEPSAPRRPRSFAGSGVFRVKVHAMTPPESGLRARLAVGGRMAAGRRCAEESGRAGNPLRVGPRRRSPGRGNSRKRLR